MPEIMPDYEVGKSYHNRYWRIDYTVLAYEGNGGYVTVQWEDGRVNRHLTARGDDIEIVMGQCPYTDSQHGDATRNRFNNWGKGK